MVKRESHKQIDSKGTTGKQKGATRAAKAGKRSVATEGEHQQKLNNAMQVISVAAGRLEVARRSLSRAETMYEALKEACEKEETAWARACIEKGHLLFQGELDGEVLRAQWDEN